MPRLLDWAQRLDALVVAAQLRPFVWGVHDCCLWAADAVLAQTGVDHAADLRGTYSDVQGAARVLKANGGLRGVASRAGPAIPLLMARTGDVGRVRYAAKPLLAVCAGDCWLAVSGGGLVVVPYNASLNAWRVGNG